MKSNPITGIACPACKSTAVEVRDSRPAANNTFIRRRRRCTACEARFTTREIVVHEDARATLILPNGRSVPFDFDFSAIGAQMGIQIGERLKQQMLDIAYQRGRETSL